MNYDLTHCDGPTSGFTGCLGRSIGKSFRTTDDDPPPGASAPIVFLKPQLVQQKQWSAARMLPLVNLTRFLPRHRGNFVSKGQKRPAAGVRNSIGGAAGVASLWAALMTTEDPELFAESGGSEEIYLAFTRERALANVRAFVDIFLASLTSSP
jgi:hypothetical protein